MFHDEDTEQRKSAHGIERGNAFRWWRFGATVCSSMSILREFSGHPSGVIMP